MIDLAAALTSPSGWTIPTCRSPNTKRRCATSNASNRVTRTHAPTLAWLERAAIRVPPGRPVSVLDVACGRGDLLRAVAARFARLDRPVRLEGIDLNPRSLEAASRLGGPITYRTGDVFADRPQPRPDFIVSSQFTHHLTDDDVVRFLAWSEANSVQGWFVSDLHRRYFSYYGFRLLCRAAFWHPIVRLDGTASIARSFRPDEWRACCAARASAAPRSPRTCPRASAWAASSDRGDRDRRRWPGRRRRRLPPGPRRPAGGAVRAHRRPHPQDLRRVPRPGRPARAGRARHRHRGPWAPTGSTGCVSSAAAARPMSGCPSWPPASPAGASTRRCWNGAAGFGARDPSRGRLRGAVRGPGLPGHRQARAPLPPAPRRRLRPGRLQDLFPPGPRPARRPFGTRSSCTSCRLCRAAARGARRNLCLLVPRARLQAAGGDGRICSPAWSATTRSHPGRPARRGRRGPARPARWRSRGSRSAMSMTPTPPTTPRCIGSATRPA